MTAITIRGNAAATPELKFTSNGTQVAEFVVIENRRRKNPAGEWEDDEPNRFRIKAWRGLAEHVAESVETGTMVTVSGNVKTERWNDKESGQARTSQHVVADDVAVSLLFQTVKVSKANRTTTADDPAPETGEPPF